MQLDAGAGDFGFLTVMAIEAALPTGTLDVRWRVEGSDEVLTELGFRDRVDGSDFPIDVSWNLADDTVVVRLTPLNTLDSEARAWAERSLRGADFAAAIAEQGMALDRASVMFRTRTGPREFTASVLFDWYQSVTVAGTAVAFNPADDSLRARGIALVGEFRNAPPIEGIGFLWNPSY